MYQIWRQYYFNQLLFSSMTQENLIWTEVDQIDIHMGPPSDAAL